MSRPVSPDSAHDQAMRVKHGDNFVDSAKAAAARLSPLNDDQVRTLRALFSTSTTWRKA